MKIQTNSAYPTSAAIYALLLPSIKKAANEHGYAVAVHGSLATDMDLIAVPWVEEAAEVEILVAAVVDAVGGTTESFFPEMLNPAPKPCGRIAYSIYLHQDGHGSWIDLSITPKL